MLPVTMSRVKSRFNLLLLEDGEFLLEEYLAMCFVWAPEDGKSHRLESKLKGRVRLCTRGIFFEPEDTRAPLTKYPFRTQAGKPHALASLDKKTTDVAFEQAVEAESLGARDAFAFQAGQGVEIKAGGMVGPYKTRTFDDLSARSVAPSTTPSSSNASSDKEITKTKSFFGSSKDTKGAASSSESKAAATSASGADGAHVIGRSTIVIALLHTSAAAVVPIAQQLWDIQHACIGAYSGRERSKIEPLLAERRDGPFDLSLLGDYRERTLLAPSPLAISGERVYPLVTCPGRVMVTEKAVYFQPARINNVAGSDPVQKWQLREIQRVLRRPRLQRQVGLELILEEGESNAADAAAAGLNSSHSAATSVFFAFATPAARDDVYRAILGALRDRHQHGHSRSISSMSSAATSITSPAFDAGSGAVTSTGDYDDVLGDFSPSKIAATTRAWQARGISNLEYLLFLNSVAGRTQADLTQYPVLPWVIADYTSQVLDFNNPATFRDLSKPIGALNQSRLESFRMRFKEMPRGDDFDPPFIYGTHYSTPGYCLYYLVRAMPEHMLRLQAGRFDAPDRLFFDLAATWKGVTSPNSDLKELIPEFYNSDGSFLLIDNALDLGVRQTGKRVGDVALPPWAYDAGDFVSQCRDALESDYVSEHIHEWVDLIFGFKQRGQAAEDADNLFYYLTYDGAVDLESVTDPDKRAALQAQIAEFGQTPRQLFTKPHPSRSGAGVPATPSIVADVGNGAGSIPAAVLESASATAAAVALPIVKAAEQQSRDDEPDSITVTTTAATENGVAVPAEGALASDVPDSSIAASGPTAPISLLHKEWKSVNVAPAASAEGAIFNGAITSISHQAASEPATDASTPYAFTAVQIVGTGMDGTVRSLSGSLTSSPTSDGLELNFVEGGAVIPSTLSAQTSPSNMLLSYSALSGSIGLPLHASCASPDGRVLFVSGMDGALYAIDIKATPPTVSGELRPTLPDAPSAKAAAGPILSIKALLAASKPRTDGKKGLVLDYVILVGHWDGAVSMWPATLKIREKSAGADEAVGAAERLRLKFTSDALAVMRPFAEANAAQASPITTIATQHSSLQGHAAVHVLIGDASGRLAMLAVSSASSTGKRSTANSGITSPVMSSPSRTADAFPIVDLDLLAVSDALIVDPAARGDLSAGGVSGCVEACFLPAPKGSSNRDRTSVAVALSDGRIRLCCGEPGQPDMRGRSSFHLWNAAIMYTGEVLRCTALLDSCTLATAGNSGTVRLWSIDGDAIATVLRDSKPAMASPLQLHSCECPSLTLRPTTLAESVSASSAVQSSSSPKEWITSLTCGAAAAGDGRPAAAVIIAGRRGGDVVSWAA